jgi:hypothetical protein
MNLRFNLPRFTWAAWFLLLVVLVLPQSILAERNFSLNGSFHVGSTYPLSYLNGRSDSNIHFRFDLGLRYQLTDKLAVAAVGFYGFNQFTQDPIVDDNLYWRNISVNAKVIWSFTNYYLYLQAGPGSYKTKENLIQSDYTAGQIDSGYNVGGGFQVKMSGSSRLEFGVDYHRFNASGYSGTEINTEFLTLQLGVIFPLF